MLTVPIEIVRKRDNSWIFFALFLGIFTGFMLRHFLKDRKAAAEARLKDLNDRAAVIQEEAKVFYGYFETGVLSDVMRLVIQPAEASYRATKAALIAMNPDEARTQLNETTTTIREQLIGYRNNSKSLITSLQADDATPAFISPLVRQQIKANLEMAGRSLDQLQTDKTDAKSISDNIILADTAQTNLGKTIEFLQKCAWDAFGSIWKDNGSAEMAAFKKAFDEWRANLDKAGIYPFKVPDAGVLANLNAAWTAVQKAAPPKAAAGGLGLLELPGSSLFGNILSWIGKNYFSNSALPGWIGPGPGGGQTTYQQSLRKRLIYGAIELILLNLLIGLVAYKFYAPDFTGTWNELIGIFFVGFGLDITVDNVAELKFKN